jgi:hypothetical protein
MRADIVQYQQCLNLVIHVTLDITAHFNRQIEDRRIVHLGTFALLEVKTLHHATLEPFYLV